jgi:WD40 repeat protein
VAWNCSGKKLASGSVDQTARIWHIEPHGHVFILTDQCDPLFSSLGYFGQESWLDKITE